MSVSYKKLWKLLIDRDISKPELRQMTGIAPSTFSRMSKNEFVSLEVIGKICVALQCSAGDIVDFNVNEEKADI